MDAIMNNEKSNVKAYGHILQRNGTQTQNKQISRSLSKLFLLISNKKNASICHWLSYSS